MFIILDCGEDFGGHFDGGMGICRCPEPTRFKWKCDMNEMTPTIAMCCEESKYWPIN